MLGRGCRFSSVPSRKALVCFFYINEYGKSMIFGHLPHFLQKPSPVLRDWSKLNFLHFYLLALELELRIFSASKYFLRYSYSLEILIASLGTTVSPLFLLCIIHVLGYGIGLLFVVVHILNPLTEDALLFSHESSMSSNKGYVRLFIKNLPSIGYGIAFSCVCSHQFVY